MNKRFLLFAGCLFASCSGNNVYQVQEARIDSTVSANVARHEAENAVKKDSILFAIEKRKADSITAASEKGGKKQP